jgi:hypothetical protein
MEIDSEKLKDVVRFMFDNLKKLETELIAHRLVFEAARLALQIPTAEHLESARHNPAVAQQMDEKYHKLVESVLIAIDAAKSGQDLVELLRTWKPSGPPN